MSMLVHRFRHSCAARTPEHNGEGQDDWMNRIDSIYSADSDGNRPSQRNRLISPGTSFTKWCTSYIKKSLS